MPISGSILLSRIRATYWYIPTISFTNRFCSFKRGLFNTVCGTVSTFCLYFGGEKQCGQCCVLLTFCVVIASKGWTNSQGWPCSFFHCGSTNPSICHTEAFPHLLLPCILFEDVWLDMPNQTVTGTWSQNHQWQNIRDWSCLVFKYPLR